MTDIDDDKAASRALEPVAAKELTNYGDQVQFAQLMAKAKILPAHLHSNPGNCLAVVTMAANWNMNPIMVGLKTSVIPKKGGGETLMFEGQLVNAVINKSKLLQGRLTFELAGKGDSTTCLVRGRLKGESEDRTVTIAMPKTRNSPLWSGTQDQIEQQMTYLGTRTWCRRHVPEVLLGVYTPEDDWTEREDVQTARRSEVGGQLAALEARTEAPTGIPIEHDDFIENEPAAILAQKQAEKPAAARQISENPEDRKEPDPLDERIPNFDTKPACATCDDTGEVEEDGKKAPCFICKK